MPECKTKKVLVLGQYLIDGDISIFDQIREYFGNPYKNVFTVEEFLTYYSKTVGKYVCQFPFTNIEIVECSSTITIPEQYSLKEFDLAIMVNEIHPNSENTVCWEFVETFEKHLIPFILVMNGCEYLNLPSSPDEITRSVPDSILQTPEFRENVNKLYSLNFNSFLYNTIDFITHPGIPVVPMYERKENVPILHILILQMLMGGHRCF